MRSTANLRGAIAQVPASDSAPAISEGSYQGMGVVFPLFARFRTILIDTARNPSESARIEYETARYPHDTGRKPRAFLRYLAAYTGDHVPLIVQFRNEIARSRARIVENRTGIVRFRATIVRNRTGTCKIGEPAICDPPEDVPIVRLVRQLSRSARAFRASPCLCRAC
jgi:hypothetical protein